MQRLTQLLARRVDIPFFRHLEKARAAFSYTEQVAFGACCALLAASALALAARANDFFLVSVPMAGGSFTEGIVGTPRFINPLLAASDADRDLTALVYAGLMRATPEGELIPDLAESYMLSEDGRIYTFTLKSAARFHDGTPVTADDVVFTVQKAQDPLIKSGKRANWEGIAVEKTEDGAVRFTLKQAYAPFLENATLGVLPKHLWALIDAESFQFSQLNREPVGAGPYQITRIRENTSRMPIAYELTPFADYALGKPFIARLIVRFFGSESALVDAFVRKNVESVGGISSDAAAELEKRGFVPVRTPLPRVFGIFFNQNQSKVLSERAVRAALQEALDKDALVDTVLGGYGSAIDGPLPPAAAAPRSAEAGLEGRLMRAQELLEADKWNRNKETGILEKKYGAEIRRLSFSLATAATPELKRAAEFAATAWREIGAQVELKFFDTSDLHLSVIRPRAYDALLFGEIVGRDLDLFAFWHSSQRNDPGLNIALYTNIKADRLLEEARGAREKEKRDAALNAFAEEIQKDIPAIFLYTPDYIYFFPEKARGLSLGRLALPHERWGNIYHAYINTEKVWPFFTK